MDTATLLILALNSPGDATVSDSVLILIYFMFGFTHVWIVNGPEMDVLSEHKITRIFQRLGLLFLWPLLILFGLFKMMTR
jgi:hypothetical protein